MCAPFNVLQNEVTANGKNLLRNMVGEVLLFG